MTSKLTIRRRLTAALLASVFVSSLAIAQETAQEPQPQGPAQHLRLVSLRSSVGFAFSQGSLDGAAQLEIEALGAALASLPDAQITVSGYTDASGPGEINLQLSQQRAASVKQALESAGVDAARIRLEANGEWFSQALPITPTAQQRQRRVDIRVEQAL